MRSFTVQNIIDRALKKADMFNTDYIGDDEAMDIFNEEYANLYDILVGSFSNYFVQEQFITLDPQVFDYALPADYYKTVGFDYEVNQNTKQYFTLMPFMETERNGLNSLQSTVPTGRLRHRYVPAPQIYTDATLTVDGISGWEEIIVNGMAMEFLGKEESSTTRLERRQEMLMKRIEQMSQNRDVGMPGRVSDVTQISVYAQYQTLQYQLNQDTVRLLSVQLVSPQFLSGY